MKDNKPTQVVKVLRKDGRWDLQRKDGKCLWSDNWLHKPAPIGWGNPEETAKSRNLQIVDSFAPVEVKLVKSGTVNSHRNRRFPQSPQHRR